MTEIAPTELLELFQRAQNQFTDRVDAVEPGQWDDEALPGWTVGDLVAHLVTEMLWVAPLLAGEPYAEGRFPQDTDDLLGDDPFTVHLPRGPAPAADYALELTADLTVHAWDLARAIGADTELDGELVTAALLVGERLPEDGVPGLFGPPVDTSPAASPQQRLLARFGRRPL
jgi:uncharacterized protein (TIGR03083 family)